MKGLYYNSRGKFSLKTKKPSKNCHFVISYNTGKTEIKCDQVKTKENDVKWFSSHTKLELTVGLADKNQRKLWQIRSEKQELALFE